MKKTIFATLAAALVLASCAKVEVTEVPDSRAIGFDNFVTNAVKSIDNADALSTFYVYGGPNGSYSDFTNVEVTKQATGEWGYTPAQYWESIGDVNYQFAAYSNDNQTATGDITFNDTDFHLILANYTTDGSKDLIYAYAHNQTYNNTSGTVSLDFRHILSKIIFRFSKNETLNGSDLVISEVNIKSVKNTGTFSGKDIAGSQHDATSWTPSGEGAPASFDFANEAKLTDDAKTVDSNPEFLIPQATGETLLQVEFTVTPSGVIADEYSKGVKTFSVDLPVTTDNTWKPGLVYIYSAIIDAENFELKPIEFDVTMNNNWDDPANESDDILPDTEF